MGFDREQHRTAGDFQTRAVASPNVVERHRHLDSMAADRAAYSNVAPQDPQM
jgi:hypothetical protein